MAPDPTWRVSLGRRLSILTAVMSAFVLVPVTLGTTSPSIRMVLVVVTTMMVVGLGWLSRQRVSTEVRGVGVVTAFFLVGLTGYTTVGFLGAPAVGFSVAVVVSGLLLGRRAMYVTTALVCVAIAIIGTLMVGEVIAAPPIEDISPRLTRTWLRSNTLTLLLILILGAAVTWVVEKIEATGLRLEHESRRRREAERHAVNAQATELIGRVAAGLAHDVNNQLTVIGGWTSLVAADADAESRTEAAVAISGAIRNASALTTQLLVLGRREVRAPRRISLRRLVHAHLQTLGRLLPVGIEVGGERADEAWCVADEAQLHQVLLNLVLNARDALPDGGRIEIRTAVHRDPHAVVGHRGAIPPGEWAVLEVHDTGLGMDEATRTRAFEPFFTTKPTGEGTGLGLSTILGIAEQSAGHVVLESEIGAGTTVGVWLPATTPAAPSKADSPTPRQPAAGTRVLLVEDNAQVLEVARRGLTAAGFVVVTATSGDKALSKIAEARFDILCSDVIMPGAPVARVVREFGEANGDAPILLCSGHVEEDEVRHRIEAGGVHFLPKPYELAELTRTITDLTHAASPRRDDPEQPAPVPPAHEIAADWRAGGE